MLAGLISQALNILLKQNTAKFSLLSLVVGSVFLTAGFSIACYGLYLYLTPVYGEVNAILAIGVILLVAGGILTFALPRKQPTLEEKVAGAVKDWNEKLHLPQLLQDIKKTDVSHYIEENIKKILLFSLIIGIIASKYNNIKKGQEK